MRKSLYNPSKPFNKTIREIIKPTQPRSGPITVSQFGKRFKVERDHNYWKDFSELTGSDTVGTKGAIHWKMGTMAYCMQDAFAMVVDDLIEGGFVPVILQSQILFHEENRGRILSSIEQLVKLCRANRWRYAKNSYDPIIISGGETAIVNTLEGVEMGVTATGYARKGHEIRPGAKEGDVILGLGSSGVHSNGLSFFRNEFFAKRKMRLSSELPWGTSVGRELTRPTNVYLPAIKALMEALSEHRRMAARDVIHGMVHITGGGFSKLKELSPGKRVDIVINRGHSLRPQPIFRYAHDELGVPSGQMYTRFNNGVGFAIAIAPQFYNYALSILRKYFRADRIGYANRGSGKVLIESEYDNSTVRFS